MRFVTRTALMAVAVTVVGGQAQAFPLINGTLSMASQATANTGSILTATTFTFTDPVTPGNQLVTNVTGEFAPFIPVFSGALSTALTPNPAPGNDITVTFGTAGAFTGNTTADVTSTQAGSNLRDITVTGTFTPAGAFAAAGYVPTPTTVTFSFNQPATGGAIGYGASLISVPEPASVAMIGIGLAGVAGVAARRARRSA